MNSWINDLEYILMSSSHPLPGLEIKYAQAYECWRLAWNKYRKEVGICDPLSSDGFKLPGELGAIFYQKECIGLSCFTHGSFQDSSYADLSWFLNGWSEMAVHKLKGISLDPIICSQFTVHPKFSGKDQIVRWKEIVSLFSLMRCEHSLSGVMAGQLNLIRGMQNAASESFGGIILSPNEHIRYAGKELPVQLVAYTRDSIQKMKATKGINEMCDLLWSKLQARSSYPIIQLNEFAYTAA
jgi:hypothetical protein